MKTERQRSMPIVVAVLVVAGMTSRPATRAWAGAVLDEVRTELDRLRLACEKQRDTVHAGQIHVLNVLKDRVDIPTLILESDICDIMAFDEARIRGEIDAFIEVLGESVKRNN